MADYKKMYHSLFNAVSDAVELLQKAQRDTEEMYISGKDAEITLIYDKNKEDSGD